MGELSNLRVMLVDDDSLILDVMEAALRTLEVTTIYKLSDGSEAVEVIERAQDAVDVIFCDLNMPNMDGLTLLRHLDSKRYQGVLIFMSGEDRRILNAATTLTNALELKLAGASMKPINQETLHNHLIKAQRLLHERANHEAMLEVTESQLRYAIQNDEIEVFYQPKVSAADKSLRSAEALARWRSPEFGLVSPSAFIPLAEKTGLVSELFDVVAKKAIDDVGDWHRQGYDMEIAINMSVASLHRLELPNYVLGLTKAANVQPNKVILEVTESQLMTEILRPLEVLCRTAMLGFRLSIDDFGTGYSSMSKLAMFPFHELKIDREFVNGAGSDEIALSILEISALLGRKLGMSVVAEGVENQQDWDVARDAGADIIQGYFIARPMPRQEFEIWLSEWEKSI